MELNISKLNPLMPNLINMAVRRIITSNLKNHQLKYLVEFDHYSTREKLLNKHKKDK